MIDFKKILLKNQAALVISDVNRRYLTGFPSSSGYLLITNDSSILFIDGRYYEAACKSCKETQVVLQSNIKEQLQEYIQKLNITTLSLESDITVRQAESIKNTVADLSIEYNLSEYLIQHRSVKKPFEIKNILEAQRISEKAFLSILNIIKVGITEKELALELDYTIKKLGADDISFETIVVSGENSSMPHGVPSDRKIKNGDFITMDFGAVSSGYHSDMTRTVAVGFVTDKMNEVYNTVLLAGNTALSELKPGMRCSDVDFATREVIESAGYGDYFTHSTGHGVGLEIHEEPRLSSRSSEFLLEGNVVTIEPGIYIPGEFGVRIEDMAVINNTGCNNLTFSDKNLNII